MKPNIFVVLLFFSGVSGLVYEVVWLRMLGLVFGHTVYAVTTVLASFMGGLALGSFVFAGRAARVRRLVFAYGLLEIGIGVYCVFVPGILRLISALYPGLHRLLNFSYDAFSFVQFLVVFSCLLIPTALMGGTLPILSQALVRQENGLRRTVGTLYAVNTFGAVVGVVLAGYVLLPAFGNMAAIIIAALGNIVVGLVAVNYAVGRNISAPSAERQLAAESAPTPTAQDLGTRLTIVAFGISGAVSMIFEVAWTRALALVIGSSTYAFSSMLVAFLVGIAGGSALYTWLFAARRHFPATFGVLQAAIGLTAAITLVTFRLVPELFLLGFTWSDSATSVQLIQFVVSASVLLPATVLIGATFPCAVAVVARLARVGQDVGRVYAVNTLGAIGGAVLAGFALIQAVGLHTTLKLGIAANLLLAGALFIVSPWPTAVWRWSGLAIVLAGAGGVFVIPPWDQRLMSSGPAIYAKQYVEGRAGHSSLTEALTSRELLFYRDGPSATVSVHRIGVMTSLRVNGKTDASVSSDPRVTSTDIPTQIMLGHLPMLFHAGPRTVLVIGLGSGVTAGAVARHPVERMDVVEIEPAVVEASRFFADANGDVFKDGRVRTTIADGRNFLLTTSNRYDVIISEPSNPWIGGTASLFTIEFFELARQRLRPGGIMLQWIQAYNLFSSDLQMVVKTFRTVFPATSVWNPSGADFLLVGRTEPEPVDLELVKARYEVPGVRRDLEQIGVRAWPDVFGYFTLNEADTARFAESARLNTDDRLPLEFSAPRALYLDTSAQNWKLMTSFKTTDLPEVTARSRDELDRPEFRHGVGVAYLRRGAREYALSQFLRALGADPQHVPSLVSASEVSLELRRPTEALDLARRALAREPRNASALFAAALASEELNAPRQAVAFLEQAIALQPENSAVRQALWRLAPRAQSDARIR